MSAVKQLDDVIKALTELRDRLLVTGVDKDKLVLSVGGGKAHPSLRFSVDVFEPDEIIFSPDALTIMLTAQSNEGFDK